MEKGDTFRDRLKRLKVGQSLVQECGSGYELHSRRTNAYQLAQCEGITLRCVKDGKWRLLVTRTR